MRGLNEPANTGSLVEGHSYRRVPADRDRRYHVMTEHRIGTQEEWQAERDELLKEEKELTRRRRAGQ